MNRPPQASTKPGERPPRARLVEPGPEREGADEGRLAGPADGHLARDLAGPRRGVVAARRLGDTAQVEAVVREVHACADINH